MGRKSWNPETGPGGHLQEIFTTGCFTRCKPRCIRRSGGLVTVCPSVQNKIGGPLESFYGPHADECQILIKISSIFTPSARFPQKSISGTVRLLLWPKLAATAGILHFENAAQLKATSISQMRIYVSIEGHELLTCNSYNICNIRNSSSKETHGTICNL